MRKPNTHEKLSDQKCACGCNRNIKQNVVDRKQKAGLLAFPCFQRAKEGTGNPSVTAREVRTGQKQGKAIRLFNEETKVKTYMPAVA